MDNQSVAWRFFRRPPIVFPLLALGLIALTIYYMYTWWTGDVLLIDRFQPLVVLVYTVFWTAATFMKKWGAVAFIAFTVANVCLYFFVSPDTSLIRRAFGDILFPGIPLHLFMCVLLLLYFKRME